MTALAAVLLPLLLAAAPAAAQDDGRWDARLGEVSGEVTVTSADGGEPAAGEAGAPLEEGDKVTVGEGGSAEVSLDDGGVLLVRSGSELVVSKAARADGEFTLSFGSLLAKISKLGAKRLRVRTPTAVAAVRGTEFGVEVEGEETHIGVFDEGKVEVSGDSGEPETLISNQETRVAKGKGPLRAYQLQRLMRHRQLMRQRMRARLGFLRKNWKALTPAQRQELRRKALERMREKRRAAGLPGKDGGPGNKERREQRKERVRERVQQQQQKMEDRRRRINEGRGGRRERP